MFLPTNITLQLGDSGDYVAELQRRLVKVDALAYDGISGSFDGMTVNAVSGFQSRHGLRADGVAGPETLRRLAAVTGGEGTAPAGAEAQEASADAVAANLVREELLVAGLIGDAPPAPPISETAEQSSWLVKPNSHAIGMANGELFPQPLPPRTDVALPPPAPDAPALDVGPTLAQLAEINRTELTPPAPVRLLHAAPGLTQEAILATTVVAHPPPDFAAKAALPPPEPAASRSAAPPAPALAPPQSVAVAAHPLAHAAEAVREPVAGASPASAAPSPLSPTMLAALTPAHTQTAANETSPRAQFGTKPVPAASSAQPEPAAPAAPAEAAPAHATIRTAMQHLIAKLEEKLPPRAAQEARVAGEVLTARGVKETALPSGPEPAARAQELPARAPQPQAGRSA